MHVQHTGTKKKKKEANLQNLFFANLANVVTSLNAKSYVREKKMQCLPANCVVKLCALQYLKFLESLS